jgi:peptide/nickel transport system substrate-binding protein
LKKIWVCLVLFLVVALMSSGCKNTSTTNVASTTTSGGTPQYGGTLTIIYPLMATADYGWPSTALGPTHLYMQLMYDVLLEQNLDGSFSPRLATNWEVDSDKKAVTLTLRKGVKFHDGSTFNAEAVKFSYEACMAAKRASTLSWESVEVIDEYTVKVNIKQWQSWTLSTFAYYGANWIISPTAYERMGLEQLKKNPVGTGPFKFVSMEQDVKAVFEKNENYWQEGKPYVDELVCLVVPNAMTSRSALLTGEADALWADGGKTLKDLEDEGLTTNYRSLGLDFLWPDSKDTESPLSNRTVREAVSYALDRDAIASLAYGYASAAYQAAPVGNLAYNDSLTPRTYDPDKAKQLLAEAGYSSGFSTTVTPSATKLFQDFAVAVTEQLTRIGIDAKINLVEEAKMTELTTQGTWDGFLCYPVAWSSPNVVQTFYNYINGEYTQHQIIERTDAYLDALDKAAHTTDYDADSARALIKQIYDDVMIIPIVENGEGWAFNDNVQGAWDNWRVGIWYWNPENAWLSQ